MSLKSTVRDFYLAIKTGFHPGKPILNWRNGPTNLALLSGTGLLLAVDKGTLDLATTSASLVEVDCLIVIRNPKSVTQQDDLLQYLDDIYQFFLDNPRLGGVQDIEIRVWDLSISEDGVNEGTLSLELTLTIQT